MKSTNQSPPSQERDELERQVESLRREVRQLRLEQGGALDAAQWRLLRKCLE